MLTAKIIKADGTYREYSEELIKFSWQTRNNEGASFSASIPTLTATFVLCKSDDFIKSLDRTSRVEISSDTPDGLTLPLSILEVTPLDRKGKTEISCSGNFFYFICIWIIFCFNKSKSVDTGNDLSSVFS